MAKKKRLDQMLVDRGLVESRTRAQALVMAGLVFTGEQKLAKPGQQLPEDAPLDVRGRDHPWVSRGGIKLAHAIEHFGLDPSGVTAMDIGSSTGGFTDVLLQGGAEHVFAVDSGTNQLAWAGWCAMRASSASQRYSKRRYNWLNRAAVSSP